MSGRKGKQKVQSSKAHTPSKPSKSSEPSKSRKPSKSSKPSKAKESGSSSSEPETSSGTLADVKVGEGSDESGQKTIKSQLRDLGLTEDRVKRDGNCMFESVARQIPGMTHKLLRQQACDHLWNHRTDYPHLFVNDFAKQLSKFRKDREWASGIGDIMPAVIRDVTMREIVIIQDGQDPTRFQLEESVTNSPIVIVYGVNHYDSTKPKPKSNAIDPKSEPKSHEMLDMALNETTTGTGSGIGNKKKKKKSKESDSDDEDEPTSPPQTRKQKADKQKADKQKKKKKTALMTIGGQNVESLLAEGKDKKKKKDKVNEVKTLIGALGIDIFVLGETWLPSKKHNDEIAQLKSRLAISLSNLRNFHMIRQDRTYHKTKYSSGGLIVYVSDIVEFTVDSFWEWPVNNTQFLEISVTEPTRFDLVAIYSPPRNRHTLYVKTLMRFFLDRNKVPNTPIMFVGDINIDFTRDKTNKHVVELEKLLNDHGARRLIYDPTNNAKPESKTPTAKPKSKQRSKRTQNAPPRPYCVDHIITSITSKHIIKSTGVFHSSKEISKHSLVYCSISEPLPVTDKGTKAGEVIRVCQLKNDTNEVSLLESLLELVKTNNRCVLTLLSEGDNFNTVQGFVKEFPLGAPVQRLENGVSIRVQIDNQNIIDNLQNFMQELQRLVRCTLAIILDNPQPVNPTEQTLSYQVGRFDCFLLKCLRSDLERVEHELLREYFVCSETNNGDCYKLFNTKEKLTDHWTEDHNICPDPLHQRRDSYTNLTKHIEVKHPHHNYKCRVQNCDKRSFHTKLERDKHESTEHRMCFK